MSHAIRYSIEVGSFEPRVVERPRPGIAIAEDHDKYGYCDEIMVASIMKDEDGEVSILPMSNEHGEPHTPPSKKLLKMVRDLIDHTLEYH